MNVDFAQGLGSNPGTCIFRFYLFRPWFFFAVSFVPNKAWFPSLSSHNPCLPSSLHHRSHLQRLSSPLLTPAVRVCWLLVCTVTLTHLFAKHHHNTFIHLFAEHHRRVFVFAGLWCVAVVAAMNLQLNCGRKIKMG